jgi:pyruvate/2-oxoglutarate dehydrogenase complex dihydrolipoamide dehydrogenase (E3) component
MPVGFFEMLLVDGLYSAGVLPFAVEELRGDLIGERNTTMPLFDAIVIGTGQAGPSLATRLTEAGMKVAVVERHKFGGTCVNTGCTPTKTLVASAYAAYLARRAGDLGIKIEGRVSTDMSKVKARKDHVTGLSSQGLEQWLRGNERCTVYNGHARFASSREVRVNGDALQADRIFVNVGGRALTPPIPGLDQVEHLNNSSLLDLDFVPRHLVIVGGSYIGLELAQVFRRFGSEVTVVELAPRLLPREDEDVSAAITEFLTAEGITIHVNTKTRSVAPHNDGIALALEGEGAPPEVAGSHLMLAVGRRPNTDDLGLEHAGVLTDPRGYITVDAVATNVPGIWALGDCNGRDAFTHTAYNDFEIVAANLLDNDQRGVSDRITAYNLYTDPPLGRVGMTEAEVRKSGRRALKADLPMKNVSRAFEKGETNGFMRVIVDQDSKEILGASVLGVSGDEVIHTILALMYARAPYTVLQRAMFIHPTVSELLPTMMGRLKPL